MATDRLVEFVDLYPTLCELCGLDEPPGLEGQSFTPLLDGKNRPWKSAAFGRYIDGDSIRTDRYLYTEYTDDAGRLLSRMCYDHNADPDENVNIVDRPDMAGTVAGLAEQLHAGWVPARPSDRAE